MKIALLGLGKEGQSTEKYFKNHFKDVNITIFDNFTYDEVKDKDFSSFDYVFRSPSVPPLHLPNETSVTKYFFDHCPCEIIGVTATKGKGTTCSFIKALLDTRQLDTYLVGNIGVPAFDILDQLTTASVVVYELSSFQLWDLQKSPHIAVLGQLEPDHLNIHKNYADYLTAKANITKYQTGSDYLVYFSKNPETTRIANTSQAHLVPYPFRIPEAIATAITLPGQHNQDNAIAAIATVASFLNISPDEYLQKYQGEIIQGLQSFHGLPHRLEFLRELDGVKYYDDNFSTNPSSTRVAVNAFPNSNLIAIIGGRDKTDNADLPEIYDILSAPQVRQIILLGESGHALADKYQDPRFILVESLSDAVATARSIAENLVSEYPDTEVVVLMSPSAASFDMFENVYDRGAKFQALIKSLK